MLYPLKFEPVYKDYLWGGRNLAKVGKKLPQGIVAESWEISCHSAGVSVVSNGELKETSLPNLIKKYGRKVVGKALEQKDIDKFPLLLKLIDANDWLSVQVHPEDSYAQANENGELGKYEMWYVLSAKPGAKLIYGVKPGLTRETFEQAVKDNRIENCLNYIEVSKGDVINIPAGLVHATGPDIVVAEIQQNSNTTYRIYDFDRVDKFGNKRPLNVEKALEVINFNANGYDGSHSDITVKIGQSSTKTYKVVNKYFSVELYNVNEKVNEIADGSRFYMYLCIEGEGEIEYSGGTVKLQLGESVLIPAEMGEYTLKGDFKALKSYVPDIEENIMKPLKDKGYSEEKIYESIIGLK